MDHLSHKKFMLSSLQLISVWLLKKYGNRWFIMMCLEISLKKEGFISIRISNFFFSLR